jgi:serine/threonine protein kinase
VVLSDLNLAWSIHTSRSLRLGQGTRGFIAPELTGHDKDAIIADGRADVYSFGKTLAVLADRAHCDWPDHVASLIGECMNEDPHQRPTYSTLLQDRCVQPVGIDEPLARIIFSDSIILRCVPTVGSASAP